jgi:hypothetical protein
LKEATQTKREMCPSVEALEAKALLSQVGVGMGAMRHQIADLTKHMGLRAHSGLANSLTTNQASYPVGQNVQMTLTASNDTTAT